MGRLCRCHSRAPRQWSEPNDLNRSKAICHEHPIRNATGRRRRALALGGLSLVLTHLAWATPFAYISNSGINTVSVINTATNTVQFVNAQGVVQGQPVTKSLAAIQSAINTTGTLMQQAGIRTFNPANLLRIVTGPIKGMSESLLQSVYTPSITAPPVMMVYTCEPEAPRY